MASLWWIVGGLVGLLTALVVGLSIRAKSTLDTLRTVGIAAKEMAQGVAMLIRLLRALIVIILGVAVSIAGMIMIVTPGPGLLVIIAGLAILGTELVWARRLMVRLRHAAGGLGDMTGVTGHALPPDAGPARRFVFQMGRGVRRVADWVGLSWLTRKLAERIDRIPLHDHPKAATPRSKMPVKSDETAQGHSEGGPMS